MAPNDLRALIARIKLADTKVKAWRDFPDENALNSPPNGEFQNSIGPLSGLTVGVKDIIDVVGIPTRHGSPIYENAPPAVADAECVALMRAAGATIVGKTVTTELATFVPSVTRNPRNLNHTPGGSSSGSAAAVAAGHVDIAIGTQTAGSIIRPAAYCGVFGFKPSFGLVPRGGVKIQSETLDTVGVFANSIEHCEAWLAAMLRQNVQSDMSAVLVKRKLRIAVIADLSELISVDMQTVLQKAIERLRSAGHLVSNRSPSLIKFNISEQQQVIQNFEAARAYYSLLEFQPTNVNNHLRKILVEGSHIPYGKYLESLACVNAARGYIADLFSGIDAILLPSAPDAAPPDNSTTGSPSLNRFASVMHLPALNMPAMQNAHGLPMGLQLLGAYATDLQFLKIAQRLYFTIKETSAQF